MSSVVGIGDPVVGVRESTCVKGFGNWRSQC